MASDWAAHYDERLAARVFEIARADFDEFGYERESWRAAGVAASAPGVFTGG